MSTTEHKETRQFQTEVRQLLDLMIHSLYGNKEVFLRELISNASDAVDKLRFEGLSNETLYEEDPELRIRLQVDAEARTLTISDNGIGMSHDEVVENIGTIARSGTREFLKSMSGDQAKDANLIGQFGVGFYSAFIVADKVTLVTRRAGAQSNQGVRWESEGTGEYTVEMVEVERRGTAVTLHLREDEGEFLDDWRLRSVIRKFSDHVPWPIEMEKETEDPEDKEKKIKEWERINQASALWARSKSEITEEEYAEFYKHVSHDFQEPLAHIHAHLEGKYEYTVLLYVPDHPPFDLWDRERKHGVKLYVRRVFIMEGSDDLMPRYLRFIRGVVDSADLPLNVSREILQKNRAVEAIRKGMVGKTFDLLEDLIAKEPEKYTQFWKNFGVVIKEGIIEDFANRERIAKLLRFSSTHNGTAEQVVTLADYRARMKSGQKKIYYVTGETFGAVNSSPHLEIFRKRGIEVLLLHDRVDEWMVSHLHEFDGTSLQAITKGELELDDMEDEAEKKIREETAGAFAELVERVKAVMGEEVKEVRMSHRLTDSPSCLVGDEFDISPSMEHILRAAGQEVPVTKRSLELNPTHPLVLRLKSETDEGRFGDWCVLLRDQALLREGGVLENPADFVRRLNTLLMHSV